ncbi:MAG: zf-HC2 domain-containing protein [Acidobacteriota bacterium]|nr:zf-HC2 domain-containing protein [Acidobacteriota bacterium]
MLALLSEYLDGELSAEAASRVDAHLAACGNCGRFGAGMARLLRALPAARPGLTAGARARLRKALPLE